MFSKRSETYKQLIVAHLYRNSLIFEVSRGASLVQSEVENVFAFRAQPKKEQRDVSVLVEAFFTREGKKKARSNKQRTPIQDKPRKTKTTKREQLKT